MRGLQSWPSLQHPCPPAAEAPNPPPHPEVKTTYLLSTAAVAGFLAREDGKRPAAQQGL